MRQIVIRHGFTLIELLMVVLILGAISAIALPRVVASADTAKEKACQTNIDVINRQAELYNALTGSYPSDLSRVTSNTEYFPDGAPVCAFKGTYSLNSSSRVVCSHSSSSADISPYSIAPDVVSDTVSDRTLEVTDTVPDTTSDNSSDDDAKPKADKKQNHGHTKDKYADPYQ